MFYYLSPTEDFVRGFIALFFAAWFAIAQYRISHKICVLEEYINEVSEERKTTEKLVVYNHNEIEDIKQTLNTSATYMDEIFNKMEEKNEENSTKIIDHMEENNHDILKTLETLTSTIYTLKQRIATLEKNTEEMSEDIVKVAANDAEGYLMELSQKMVQTMTDEMGKYYTMREEELNCRAASLERDTSENLAKLEYVYENMQRLLNHDVKLIISQNSFPRETTYMGKRNAYIEIARTLNQNIKYSSEKFEGKDIVYFDSHGVIKPCNGLNLFTKEELKRYVSENADIILETDVRISIKDIAADIRVHYNLYSLTVEEITDFIKNNLVRSDASEVV